MSEDMWVVRNEQGLTCDAFFEEPRSIDVRDAVEMGYTVTRETLLTPLHRAVIDAALAAETVLNNIAMAEAYYGGQLSDDVFVLVDATKALRALEGGK